MTTRKTAAYVACVGTILILSSMITVAQAPVAADTYVNAGAKNTNYGGGANLVVRSGASATKGFIQFNFNRLPSTATGASVTKATMRLFVGTVTTAGTFDVVLVTSSWTELGTTYNLQPTLGPVAISGVPVTTSSGSNYLLVNVTSLVNLWLNGTGGGGIANYGLALVPSSGSGINVQFDSKENGTTSHNAEIEIDYIDSTISNGLNQEVVNRQNGDASTLTQAETYTNSQLVGYARLASINQFTASQNVTGNLGVSGNLNLPATTSAGAGVLTLGGTSFLHSFGSGNTFLGYSAGNFVMTGGFNTAVGSQSLFNSTSGTQNTALGFQALLANTTGSNNTANGLQALLSNTTGFQNTGSGVGALSANTSGFQNTATGVSALAANQVGNQNTATGDEALQQNTTGNQNTAEGFTSLQLNTTGSNNTALGYLAGVTATTANANKTGSNNTFLGYNSGLGTSTQLSNATAIGANALVSQSNAMVLGDGTINVGIGTQTPGKTLDIVGDFRSSGTATAAHFVGDGSGLTGLPAGAATSVNCAGCISNAQLSVNYAGSASQGGPATSALTATTAASATNALALGGLSASSFATLGANTFTGNQIVNGNVSTNLLSLPTTTSSTVGVITSGGNSLLHNFGTNNMFVGAGAGNFSMIGSQNVAVGPLALSSNIAGNENTAVGSSALRSNTGDYNTAVGAQALQANAGTGNTAVGINSLYASTTGTYNTALGLDSLNSNTTGTSNTATGTFSLEVNTGNYNTASGYNALAGNTTGQGNTAIGTYAGSGNYANTTGSNNTFLGYETGLASATQVVNSTAIGVGTLLSQSNTIILGNGGISVGIGTSAPGKTLDVLGDIRSSGTATAAHFVGDGSGLTGLPAGAATSVNCSGCITNTQLAVNYAGSASQGGPATSALTASAATTAATATNALALGGLAASSFATLAGNTFTADQVINGNVTANSVNLPVTTSSSLGVINSGGGSLLHTFGTNNVFLGAAAGNFAMTGTNNTVEGMNALQSNTSGGGNTASGASSLAANNSGMFNTADGYFALLNNTNGGANTASGANALLNNTTGTNNTASGAGALGSNTTGANNVAIGWQAGYSATPANANTTGSNNTFLGYQSGPGTSSPISNATAIGSGALVSASNAMVLGDGTINVGIGTQTPGKTLDVVGDIRSSGTATAAHFVGDGSGLTGIPAGAATSVNCAGCITNAQLGVNYAGSATQGGSATSALTADQATNALFLAGMSAGSFATLGANTFTANQIVNGTVTANVLNLPATTGASAGVITFGGTSFVSIFGSANTFLGYSAGNFTMSGSQNTATGFQALMANTTGSNNTANGLQALLSNTTGFQNTASGVSALSTNTTGSQNTADGVSALAVNTIGSQNTADGDGALGNNSSGNQNTAAGFLALDYNRTGSNNTALGYFAGLTTTTANANTTGSNNTFLGYNAGPGTPTQLTNATAIGSNALVSQNNAMVLGDGTINVGIGTQSPAHTLDVVGDGNFSGNLNVTGALNVTGTVSKGGGSFKIDHPLAPANKYLSHSFVESPDMMNIYNGNATLDQKGEAIVPLPDWFGALNRDFRYQLTCIGGFAPVYIAEEISNNRFRIAGGRPGLKVSWQVTGVRQDAYANAHRIPVEEDKPANEQGFYLHPDAFGKPATQGIAWQHANMKTAVANNTDGTLPTLKSNRHSK